MGFEGKIALVFILALVILIAKDIKEGKDKQ